MRYKRCCVGCAIAILAIVLVVGISIGYLYTTRDRNLSYLYITAGTDDVSENVTVNVWIDGKLKFRNISGHGIPILNLGPGKHTIRVTASGYDSYTENVDAGPPMGQELYIWAELERK